jgi:hypothetical protein
MAACLVCNHASAIALRNPHDGQGTCESGLVDALACLQACHLTARLDTTRCQAVPMEQPAAGMGCQCIRRAPASASSAMTAPPAAPVQTATRQLAACASAPSAASRPRPPSLAGAPSCCPHPRLPPRQAPHLRSANRSCSHTLSATLTLPCMHIL